MLLVNTISVLKKKRSRVLAGLIQLSFNGSLQSLLLLAGHGTGRKIKSFFQFGVGMQVLRLTGFPGVWEAITLSGTD